MSVHNDVVYLEEVIERKNERIAELEAENQRARDEVTRLEGIIASWGEHTQMYEARIAELEAACEKAEYELDWHSDELRKLEKEEQLFNNFFDAQQMIIEELRAENQRMRAAARAVADARDALGRGDCRVNEYSELVLSDMRAHEKLAALLGGRE